MGRKRKTKVPAQDITNQIVGNAGLYLICFELTKRGWNVLPTSRNTKGIDIVIFSQDGTKTHTIPHSPHHKINLG